MSDKRPKGYTPYHMRPTCVECKYFKWCGSGSRSQQESRCTKVEPSFIVSLDDCCDEYEEIDYSSINNKN